MNSDSGSDAVFREQSLSASQMIAAKNMDIIPWLPGCRNNQRTQYFAYTQVKMEVAENSKVGMSRHFGYVYHDTNGLNHRHVWKTQSFLMNEISMVILWHTAVGEPKFRREIETKYFVETSECHQLLDIARELLEFVRRIYAGHTTNCSDA